MQIETMNVNCLDQTISINGEGYRCEHWPEADAGILSVSWRPAGASKCRGYVTPARGPAYGTNDFSLLAPFVSAWEDARERTLSRKAMQHAEAQGAFGPEPEDVADAPEYLPQTGSADQSDLAGRLADLERRHEMLKELVADSNRTLGQLMGGGS